MKTTYIFFIATLAFLSQSTTPKPIETFDEFITEIKNIDENLNTLAPIRDYISNHCHIWSEDERKTIKSVFRNKIDTLERKTFTKKALLQKLYITLGVSITSGLLLYYFLKSPRQDTSVNVIDALGVGSYIGIITFFICLIPEFSILKTITDLSWSF